MKMLKLTSGSRSLQSYCFEKFKVTINKITFDDAEGVAHAPVSSQQSLEGVTLSPVKKRKVGHKSDKLT
jgi:hypothetical protein